MALINISPIMTSNNTPSPYVVGASSIYSSTFPAYKAFNGTNIDSNDAWLANGTTGAIVIDFGSEVPVKAFEIVSRYETSGYSTTAPKTFELYGSNVSTITGFELIYSSRDEILWNSNESRLFLLNSSYLFRYYKLTITSNNGHAQACGMGLLKFYKDDGVTPPSINAKYQTQRRSLPHGSKLRLDNLTSDLPYMLAVEDDGDNEGTFRLVNHAGKFIIPMAGIKTESIWKGSIAKDGIATLSKSISNFKLLIIEIKSGNGLISYIPVPVNNIVLNKTDYLTSIPWIPTYYCSGRYGFLTEYTFTITDSANAGMGVLTVTEIIGIY